ncbi:MAG TPA: serine hydrolase, partial [Acidimicrobiales bacterium]
MSSSRPFRAVRHVGKVVAAVAFLGALTWTGEVPAGATATIAAKPTSRNLASVPSTGGAPSRSVDDAEATNAVSPIRGILDYLHTRQGVVQVALFDKLTGKTFLITEGTRPQYTASIVKADILSMWLKQYQSTPGSIPSDIPYSIQYLMQNMITMSDNVAATSLFYFGGGCAKLTEFNTLIPTSETKVGCETPTYYGWGNTTTTDADQMAIVKTLAYDNNVLTPTARAYG